MLNPPPVPAIPIWMALRNNPTNLFPSSVLLSCAVLMEGFMESLYAFFVWLINYIGHVVVCSKTVGLQSHVLTKYNTQSL